MPHTATKQSGFTLVEVLIIAPVVILFIGVFIGLLVSLTGESLVIRERNIAVYDTQSALDEIETTVSQATGFLINTNGITIASPQGKNNTNAAFTNTNGAGEPETLIVKSAATTKQPTDPTRAIIYMGSGACDSKNPAYEYLSIYFVALDTETTDPTDKALYKRIILPQFAACATPYQRGSCESSAVASNPSVCKVSDEKLVTGVSTFDISYFIGASPTAAADTEANSATDVAVALNVGKKIAGSNVSHGGNARTNSMNILSSSGSGIGGGGTTATAPTNPAVQWTRNTTDPYRTTVTWGNIGNATNYTVKYRIGGGAEQSLTIGQSASPSANLEASARKQTVQLVDIVVNTGTGSFSYGSMPAITSLPSWNECSLISGWQNYDGTYNTAGFTKTTSGAIGLKGLVRSGIIGDTLCTLPPGFRPPNRLIFNAPSSDGSKPYGNGSARLDIFPSGNVIVIAGSNAWVSLDGIIFMPSTTVDAANNTVATPWIAGAWNSPCYFNNYGGDTYPSIGYWKDHRGRVWVQGLATGCAASQNMAWLPGNMYPSGGMHYPVSNDSRGGAVNIGGSINSRPSYGSYSSTQLLYYAATGGMFNLPLYNGWVSYDNGSSWTHPTCYQGTDDIVILQGLVRAGNQAAGGMTHVGVCGPSPYMSTGRRALFTGWMNWETQGRLDLPTDGYLYPMSSDPGWTSLDGIHYIAN